MEISVDSHYVIGHRHLVNQDYALGECAPLPWLVVADGCSSVADSDVGARLLALAARHYLRLALASATPPAVAALARQVSRQARRSAQALGLAPSALQATLLVAFVHAEQVTVFLLGDGAVMAVSGDGSLELVEVGYSHNAPYYPVYYTDPAGARRYRRCSQGAEKWLRQGGRTTTEAVIAPTVLHWPVAQLRALWLASDGLSSLHHATDPQPLALAEVATTLTSGLVGEGAFVKRRLRRALKHWERAGVVHDDDIGIAAMQFRGGGVWRSLTNGVSGSS